MITAPVMKGLSRVSNGSTYYLKLYFRFNIIRFFMLKRYKTTYQIAPSSHRAKTTFKIWFFFIFFCINFNRNCWETTCINALQFLFQIFTLFNPIFNIFGTCKLNCVSCNCTPLLNFIINSCYTKYVT